MKVATLLLNLPPTLQMCLQTLYGWLFVQKGPGAHTGADFSPQRFFLQIMPFPHGKKNRIKKQINKKIPTRCTINNNKKPSFILSFLLLSFPPSLEQSYC